MFSTNFWAGKAIISGVSQGILGKGEINLAGVAADAFLVPGVSDLVGTGLEFNISIPKLSTEFKMVGYNKSFKEFALQSAISYGFSTKLRMLDSKMLKLNDLERYMLYTPNQMSNYGLQSLAEEKEE